MCPLFLSIGLQDIAARFVQEGESNLGKKNALPAAALPLDQHRLRACWDVGIGQ